jgi:hypothetical protein
LGNYFWRGGQRIEPEKEDEFFTAIVRDEGEKERVRTLSGVRKMKKLGTLLTMLIESDRNGYIGDSEMVHGKEG